MKLKSVSGFTCFVKDLEATAKFYQSLGFDIKKRGDNFIAVYLNWYRMDFVLAGAEDRPEFAVDEHAKERGAGIFINVSVEDVDECYRDILALGLKPSSQPRDWPWGNREFVLRDPDGYKLVFFKKK